MLPKNDNLHNSQVCLVYKQEGRQMSITVILTNGIVPAPSIGQHQAVTSCPSAEAHMGPEGPSNFTKKTQRFRFSHIFLFCDLDYPTNFQNPPIRAFRDNIILLSN